MSHALFFLALSITLDVIANICLKYSAGFKHKLYGILAIILILGAFACLIQTIKTLDLSIAYAVWGGLGLIATSFCDFMLFGQKIKKLDLLGIGCIIFGVTMLSLV